MIKQKYLKQESIVFTAFQGTPKTMLMVSDITGILRANICRYVANFKKAGTITKVRTGLCQITKHRAGYYTTSNIGGQN